MRRYILCAAVVVIVIGWSSAAGAAVIGSHSFTWWDDPALGVVVTPLGGPSPGPGSTRMFDLKEWHLDQAQTTQWYNGMAIAGLPLNPFNAANRAGVTAGSVIPAVAGAEAFIYEIVNVNYGSGNGFTFSGGMPGANGLSGINIVDTHGALGVTSPFPGSQFMFTSGQLGGILDLTSGYAPGALQDWDFNAYSGSGNFEWDIPNWPGPADPIPPVPPAVIRPGVSMGAAGVFGFAMPGAWFDAVNPGYAHSWDFPQPIPPPSFQVNITPTMLGFSGPMPIPEPATLMLLTAGGWAVLARRRRCK